MAEPKKISRELAERTALIMSLKKAYTLAQAGRATSDKNWEKMLKWFKGDQKQRRLGSKRANTVTNFLFSQIETIVPILTSNVPGVAARPEITFGPNADRWLEIAKEQSRLINRTFRRNEINERMAECVTYSPIFGKAYLKCTFDGEMYGGHGDIRIDAPDTRAIFLEPGKMRLRDGNYIFERTEVDQLTLTRKHPNMAKEIAELFREASREADQKGDAVYHKEALVASIPTASDAAPSTNTVRFFDTVMQMPGDRRVTIDLIEAWFQDEELVPGMIQVFDIENGKRKMTEKEGAFNKYVDGRLVQFAGNTIFTDKANDFPGIPYFEFFNYFIPGEPYGMGDIEQAIPVQEQYNIRNNQLTDGLNYHYHPIRLYDVRSGFDPDLASNAPDAWNEVTDVNGVRELTPNLPGQAAFESLQVRKQEIETIFGVREVTQGTIPGDIRSGAAIEALQEAADVRLRRKSGAIESMIKDMSRFMIDMHARFYRAGEHYDPRFHSKNDESGIGIDNVAGHMFDLEISAGVNRPRSRVAQMQERQWMFQEGIIGPLDYVESSNQETRDQIVERNKERWEQMQEAASQAALPPPQGGQG